MNSMSTADQRTIRDIVAADFRTAAVFQRYDIDFCCRGNRTVEDACSDSGLSADRVLRDIEDITALPPVGCAPQYNSWEPAELISRIVTKHHAFVREQLPLIAAHARKVASVHGGRHPEMVRVAEIFDEVADEMTSHMAKEEHVLFPYILALATGAGDSSPLPAVPFGSVGDPIRMMEAEHESAGDAMVEIRRLTNGYRVPEDGCGTYSVLLQELEAFESDLHQHVHLENNILFPKALELETAAA